MPFLPGLAYPHPLVEGPVDYTLSTLHAVLIACFLLPSEQEPKEWQKGCMVQSWDPGVLARERPEFLSLQILSRDLPSCLLFFLWAFLPQCNNPWVPPVSGPVTQGMLISPPILPSPGLYLLPAPVFPAAISKTFNLVSSSLVLLAFFCNESGQRFKVKERSP